ncbi:hypothetical protein F4561_005018 [Lipingzhangella halophila]|uniref:DUF6504 domain-containing protein n=1 Tax=Lipingzhangella halophila TaxID=1783352 RepID=A0A7W7W515_9ACTN|nr:DUF6504 family protein [Lipingzhangella halophila]MBB4934198.1 hypothetical protein [Lipingzhangella halophila]
MSLLNEQIDVRSTTGGHPALFAWRGHVYRVRRIIGSWRSPSDTPDAKDTDSGFHLVRVATESDQGEHGIADIACDTATEHWTLRRQWG